MARGPHNNDNQWIDFFFGKPIRAILSIGIFSIIGLAIWAQFDLPAVQLLLHNIWALICDLIMAALAIGITIYGLKLMLFGPGGKKKH